jgi:hypothetical protein
MSKSIIPPGGQAPLEVTVDPFRIAGFDSTKTLTLYTNDPKNPTITVDVKAKVSPEIRIEPDAINFGEIQKGQQVSHTARIIQLTDEDLEILDGSSGSNYSMEVKEAPKAEWADPSHKEFVLTVTSLPNAPIGVTNGAVRLTTNLKRLPNVMVPVTGLVKGVYTFEPSVVTLRGVDPGQTVKNVLTLKSEVPIEIVEINAPNENLAVTSRPGEAANTYSFDVTISEEPDQRWQRDTWVIKMKAGDQQFIEEVAAMAILNNGPVGQVPANPPATQAVPNN